MEWEKSQHRKDMELLERVQRRSQKWSEGWSTSPARTGWESWACSAWRRASCRETWLWPSSTWRRLFSRARCNRARGNCFNLTEGRFRLDIRKTFFYSEGAKTLKRLAQRGGRCPIPGDIQGQVGWGSEQHDLVEDVPDHCRGVGLDDLWRSLPTQSILWF